MSLRIRRGTDAQRQAVLFDQGEIIYTTDTQKLYVGDGSTTGGNNVGAALAGTGLVWNALSQTLQATTGGGLSAVVGDTAPQLGGNLTLNGHNISGTGSVNITGSITATGSIIATTGLGADLPLNGHNITGTGNINITGTVTATTLLATTVTSASVAVPDASFGLQIESKKDSSFAVGYYNGTSAAKTAITANSDVGAISIKGWNGSAYQFAGAVFASWETGAVTTDNAPLSTITLASGNGGDNNQFASLDSKGIWLSPISKTTVYSVAGTALPSAVTVGQGARAFVSDATAATFATAYAGSGSNQVPVYSDGTVWRIG